MFLHYSQGRYLPVRGWILLLVFLVIQPALAGAEDFAISAQECRLVGEFYVLDANIDFSFSEKSLEALQNGVPLTMEVHVQVRRDGAWIWEDDLLDSRLRFQIRYHALASVYQVVDLQSKGQQGFVGLGSAVSALGDIHGLPIIDRVELEPGEVYNIQIKAALDIDALPLPLRPLAYVSPSWNQSSDWHSCQINP